MKYLAVLPMAVTLFLAARCFAEKSRRKRAEWDGALVLPFFAAGFGTAFGLLFSAVVGYLLWSGRLLGLGFLVFLPIGWILQIAWLHLWLRYDGDGFLCRSFWGRTRRVSYDAVTEIRRGPYNSGPYSLGRGYDLRLLCGKSRITVSPAQKNFAAFVRTLAQKVPKSRWNGAWQDRTADIAIYVISVLPLLLCAGLSAVLLAQGTPAAALLEPLAVGGGLSLMFFCLLRVARVAAQHPDRVPRGLRRLLLKGGNYEPPKDALLDPLFSEETT